MSMLSESERQAYARDGFIAPFTAMSDEEARGYRELLEDFERELGASLPAGEARFRYKTHLLLPWVAELVRHPRIVDAVEDLIGPDILCWTCTWFIKEPGSEALTLPHQDATYFGLRPHEHVTAWLALSEASDHSGCMRFVPGSQQRGQVQHVARADPNSINGGGQRVDLEVDAERTVPAPLRPGQFSLHHTLCIHTSGANRSADRRIGLGISYVPTRVRHIGSTRMPASLVRGVDHYHHFDLEPMPTVARADDAHLRHYRRYREGYNEQIDWHAAGRGWQAGA
ncbi:MAG: phytanoyl-CoA dioxygenase family protein [Gammaproteobacteria bacterium]|nr:phytanoyl-CoA dioxygenase family protein [Gammaproteobacteria bacterium]